MKMDRLVPSILLWLSVIIVFALGPTIVSYNTAVTTNVTAATNAAYMIGMTAVDDFGGFLIIMGLLAGTGLLAFAATKNKTGSVGDLIDIIGAVILTVVSLALFSGSVISYIDAMITAGSGFEKTAYGIFTIIFYVAIIAGGAVYTGIKAAKKGKKSKSSAGNY